MIVGSSCLNLKEPTNSVKPYNKDTFANLNGTYYSHVDTNIFWSLADLLIIDYQSKYGRFKNSDSLKCKIEVIDSHNLILTVIINNDVEMGTRLQGLIYDNYFYLKVQKNVENYFGFILKIIEKRKTRIGLLSNGDLLVENKSMFTSSMFFVRGRHYYESSENNIFKRID